MVQGNVNRLLDFLERCGPDLYAMLTRLTLHEDEAEDLMQELFIKLGHSKVFDKAENPLAYARRCAVNLAFDWRKKKLHTPLPFDADACPSSNDKPQPDELVEREEMEEILRGITRLRGLGRQAFVMHYIQQDSYEDIARALNKEPHQVRALCSKAMGQLRSMLNHESGTIRREVCDG